MDFGLYRRDYEVWRTRLEYTLHTIVTGYNEYMRGVNPDDMLYFTWSDAKRAEKALVESFDSYREAHGYASSMTEDNPNSNAVMSEAEYLEAMMQGLREALPVDQRRHGNVALWEDSGGLPAWLEDYAGRVQEANEQRNPGRPPFTDEQILRLYLRDMERRCNNIIGIKTTESAYSADNPKGAQARDDFQDGTRRAGQPAKPRNVVRVKGNTEAIRSDGSRTVYDYGDPTGFAYPISPFDSRFEHLESMRSLGMRMGYLRAEDLEVPNPTFGKYNMHYSVEELTYDRVYDTAPNGRRSLVRSRPVGARAARARHGQNMGRNSEHTGLYTDMQIVNSGGRRRAIYGEKVADSLVSLSDEIGLTRLAERMSPEDYAACRDWVLARVVDREPRLDAVRAQAQSRGLSANEVNQAIIQERDKMDSEFARMRDDADVAIGLLDGLAARGINGSIRPDQREGQLKLVVEGNPRMDIRVFDTEDDGQYIGRVYSDGVIAYLNTTEKVFLRDATTGEPVRSVTEAQILSRAGNLDTRPEFVPYRALDVENNVRRAAENNYVASENLPTSYVERMNALRHNNRVDMMARDARVQQRIDDTLSLVLVMSGDNALESSTRSTNAPGTRVEVHPSRFSKDNYSHTPLRAYNRQEPKLRPNPRQPRGFSDYTDRDGEELYIYREMGNHTMNDGSEREFDNTDGNRFLRNAVNSARANLTQRIGLFNEAELAPDAPHDDNHMHGDLVEMARAYVELRDAELALGHEKPDKPVMEGSSAVASLQREYFDVLIGESDVLHRPLGNDLMLEDAEEALDNGDSDVIDYLADIENNMSLTTETTLTGEPVSREELVRRHFELYLDSHVGTFEPQAAADGTMKRFSLTGVAEYMDSVNNRYRNQTELVAVCRKAGIEPNEIRIVDRFDEQLATRLGRFDMERCETLNERIARQQDAFIHSGNPDSGADARYLTQVRDTMVQTLEQWGCEIDPDDILIDYDLRVHYSAQRRVGMTNFELQPFEGEIGPIYVPNGDGYVDVLPDVGRQYTFAPIITASLVPTDVAPGDMYERMRGTDYMTRLNRAISRQLQNDVMNINREHVGEPGNMFSFYRHESAQSKRRDIGWEEHKVYDLHMPQELVDAIKHEETHTVAFDAALGLAENATSITAVTARENYTPADLGNDMPGSAYAATRRHNAAILDNPLASGVMTPSAWKQGTRMHTIPDVELQADGTFAYVGDIADYQRKGGIERFRRDYLWDGQDFADFDQWNRDQMSGNNLYDADSVTSAINICQINMGGWNQDDAFVVSKEFAESHPRMGSTRAEDGSLIPQLRYQKAQDKLSDTHGNKGVISLVVDRNWTYAEAQARGALVPWAIFKANPDMEVAMSPFSNISRCNAGMYREMNSRETDTLLVPRMTTERRLIPLYDKEGEPRVDKNGEQLYRRDKEGNYLYEEMPAIAYDENGHMLFDEIPGAAGKLDIIIQDKAADAKSLTYTDEMVMRGRSRSAGWQLTSALAARGCNKVLQSLFAGNDGNVMDMREHLRACGMDMDATGKLQMGLDRSHDDERFLINPTPVPLTGGLADKENCGDRQDGKPLTNTGQIPKVAFEAQRKDIAAHGGILRVPFELQFPGTTTRDKKGNVVSYGGDYLPETVGADTGRTDKSGRPLPLYDMPVMSVHLRSGVSEENGENRTHEYTNYYQRISDCALEWYELVDKATDLRENQIPAEHDPKKLEKLQKTLATTESRLRGCEVSAQNAFDNITSSVMERNLSNKKNDFKSSLVSAKVKHGAQMVWSPNPGLDVDEVGMSPAAQKALGVHPGQRILLWRDPVLDDNNVRYFRVATDMDATGVSVHPGAAKVINGDFDGDCVGLAVLTDKEADREAFEKLTIEGNLLDTMHGKQVIATLEDGAEIEGYPINFGCGLDATIGMNLDTEASRNIKRRFEDLTRRINDFEVNGGIDQCATQMDVMRVRRRMVKELTSVLSDAYNAPEAQKALVYTDDESHLQSIYESNVATGAKGSVKKLCGTQSGVDNPATYCHYLGATVELGDDGNMVPGTVVTNRDAQGRPKSFRTLDDDMSCASAMNAKTCITGMPGKAAQRSGAVCRTPEAMRASQCINAQSYQKVLDWKHDGEEANAQGIVVKSGLRDTARGIKAQVTKLSDSEYIYSRVLDEKGNTQQLNTEEWVAQMKDICDKIDMTVTEDVLRRYAEDIAGGPGKMMPDIEDREFVMSVSPMQTLAFHDFTPLSVFMAAEKGVGVYDGWFGQNLRPRNVIAAQEGQEVSVVPRDSKRLEDVVRIRDNEIVASASRSEKAQAVVDKMQSHFDIARADARASEEQTQIAEVEEARLSPNVAALNGELSESEHEKSDGESSNGRFG